MGFDVSGNKLKELCQIPQPRLQWLNVSNNAIAACADYTGHPELLTLLMSENKLTNCAGLANMPKLLELNLNGNKLANLHDLRGLGSLKKLEVARNQLKDFQAFPELPALEHFDAGENQIEANGDKELACLADCSNLKTLLMAGNPWVDEKGDEFKKEVLIALDMLKIKQINDGEEVTEEDRTDAKTEKDAREAARLEAEANPDGEGDAE